MRLPESWPALTGFMVTSSMIGMTLSFNYPLLTLVLERHGAGPDLIGLNAAVYALAVFVLAPWLPRLINRLGPVPSIVLGRVVCIACFLLFPCGSIMLATCSGLALTGLLFWPFAMASLPLALPLLLIGGGALGGLYILSLTLRGDRFRGGELAVANTAFVLMYQLGAMIGPIAAGIGMRLLDPASLPLVPAVVLALWLGAGAWRQRQRPSLA